MWSTSACGDSITAAEQLQQVVVARGQGMDEDKVPDAGQAMEEEGARVLMRSLIVRCVRGTRRATHSDRPMDAPAATAATGKGGVEVTGNR